MTRITTAEQLAKAIAKRLPAITWIAADEALLLLEAADLVRSRARDAGFTERAIIEAGARFDASLLLGETQSLSLFAARKLVDVRLSVKPTREFGETLQHALATLGEDCRILVTSGRLERATLSTAWFSTLAQAVLLVELPKVEREHLPQWLAARLARQGQRGDPPVLALIADRTEGNLLAAHQQVQRLALLLPPGDLDPDQVQGIVLDSARYEVFDLVDCALAGETARALRMVAALRAEDAALPLLVWALGDCLRRLLKVRHALSSGEREQAALRGAGIFGKREGLFRHALQSIGEGQASRLLRETAHLDRMVKGVGAVAGMPAAISGSDTESQWSAVERIVIGLSGVRPLAA